MHGIEHSEHTVLALIAIAFTLTALYALGAF